jgi:hypothetical protein
VPAPKKMRPLVGVRGIARAARDWRRRSLGQGRAARCPEARRPRAGWIAVRPVMGDGGVARGGEEGPLLSPNLWLSRLSPRGTLRKITLLLLFD